jgi:hypothetical protein
LAAWRWCALEHSIKEHLADDPKPLIVLEDGSLRDSAPSPEHR